MWVKGSHPLNPLNNKLIVTTAEKKKYYTYLGICLGLVGVFFEIFRPMFESVKI